MPPRTFCRNGTLYTSYGREITVAPPTTTSTTANMKPAVVTAATYIPPKAQSEPKEVTPDDIFAELAKLTITRPAKKRR